jgi:hypothetical protein
MSVYWLIMYPGKRTINVCIKICLDTLLFSCDYCRPDDGGHAFLRNSCSCKNHSVFFTVAVVKTSNLSPFSKLFLLLRAKCIPFIMYGDKRTYKGLVVRKVAVNSPLFQHWDPAFEFHSGREGMSAFLLLSCTHGGLTS